jgi:hypothetical protein
MLLSSFALFMCRLEIDSYQKWNGYVKGVLKRLSDFVQVYLKLSVWARILSIVSQFERVKSSSVTSETARGSSVGG